MVKETNTIMTQRFQIGDRVIALSTTTSSSLQARERGRMYIVEHVRYCSGCGNHMINIGVKTNVSGVQCVCNRVLDSHGKSWTRSTEFALVDQSTLKAFEESEEYELAAIIHKILTTDK
jgi:hypothetical protein